MLDALHSPSLATPPDPPMAPKPASLLLTAADVAGLLAVSLRTVRRLDITGRLPAPLLIGRAVRWRRAEITSWLAAGAPPRARWSWPNGEPQ